jgi:enoyl-CoA hydratase/carnithine racemase
MAACQEELISRGDRTVLVVRFARPEVRNPIDEPLIEELLRILTDLEASGRANAVILTGVGDSFSAGGDMKRYQEMFRDGTRHRTFVEHFNEVCMRLETGPFLSVAMINGICVAGGLEVALACDLLTMASSARIGDGHMKFGQCPAGGAQRLVRAIGHQRARMWLLSGQLFSADEAVAAGVAVVAVEDKNLEQHTYELVDSVCQGSPLMLRNMKAFLGASGDLSFKDALKAEEETAISYALNSRDASEGLLAFAEKRVPRFTGS